MTEAKLTRYSRASSFHSQRPGNWGLRPKAGSFQRMKNKEEERKESGKSIREEEISIELRAGVGGLADGTSCVSGQAEHLQGP